MVRIRGFDRTRIAFLLLVAIGLWLPRLQGPIDLRYDAGVYYLTGVALASGKGYRILSEPGEIDAIQYPPLLPFIIAGVQLASGASDPAVLGHILRILFFALSSANALVTYAVGRRLLRPNWALFAALLATLHVETVFMSDLLFAEIPYSLVTMIFFLFALPTKSGRDLITRLTPHAWMASLLAAVAFLLRTSGLALFTAWVADNLMRRQWRNALIAMLLGVLCIGGWQAYVWQIKTDPGYASPAYSYQRAAYQFYNVGYLENLQYIDPFQPELGKIGLTDLAVRAGRNIRPLIARIGETVTAPRSWEHSEKSGWAAIYDTALQTISFGNRAVYLFAMLPIAGLIILVRRREWLLPAYIAASLALICVTPWSGQFLRYLSPLAPILGILAAIALMASANAIRQMLPKSKGAFASAPAILIASLMLSLQVFALSKLFTTDFERVTYRGHDGKEISYRLFYYDPLWEAHDTAIDWLAGVASRGDNVVTSTPHWVFIRTGLKAVMPPFEPDPVTAQALIDSVHAKYLLIDSLTFLDVSRRYLAQIPKRFPERWKEVYTANNGRAQIYERRDIGTHFQSNHAR
jgi:hypothetical protein